MKPLLLLSVLQGLSVSVLTQTVCNFTTIEQCIQPLDSYNIHKDVLFPQFKRAQLQQLCNDYNTAEACLQPIKPSCNLYRRRHYEGVEQAYDYICGEGFEVYLENYYCWGNKDLRDDVRQCNVTYQDSVRDTMLNAYIYKHIELNERLCQHINDYVFCIKDTVKDMCNSSSADWQHEVNVKSLSPVLQEMNCTIYRPPLNAGEIAGIVIACVIVLVFVIILIYYCTCNVDNYRKKQKLYLNQQNSKAKSKPTVRPAPSTVPPVVTRQTTASAPPTQDLGSSRRSSMRKNNKTPSNSSRLNLSFADDIASVRSSEYIGHNTYQSLPSYTQAMEQDQSRLSNDQSFLEESGNWKEKPQKRPKDVPRLF